MKAVKYVLALVWGTAFVMVGDEVHANCTKEECVVTQLNITSQVNGAYTAAYFKVSQAVCTHSMTGNNGRPEAAPGDPAPQIDYTFQVNVTAQDCQAFPTTGTGGLTNTAVFAKISYNPKCGGQYNCP